MKHRSGDHLTFFYKGQHLKGTVVNEEEEKLVLKLDTGYNITVAPAALKDVKEERVEKKKTIGKKEQKDEKEHKEKGDEQEQKEGLPKIMILHTGGTIASKVDYATGAVVAKFTAEEILSLVPELRSIANVSSTLIKNMQSDDMRFDHYNIIGEAIVRVVEQGCDGIIVTHGTDTLHYTAAALGFALEHLPVPVVLVGSQRSSDRGSSDAASNLIAACQFIATKHAGVFTCLHAGTSDDEFSIIDCFHARKMHSSRRDAFRAINTTPFAVVKDGQVVIRGSNKTSDCQGCASQKEKMKFLLFNPKLRIGMLYLHPNMYAHDVDSFKEYDGLVLIGTGLGHAPITEVDEFCKEHPKILKAIEHLAKKGIVVMTTQTIYGRVNMDVYSPGRTLQEAGVLGQGCDLTPETAFIKLAWLLSNYPLVEAKRLYGENLRGEISERSDERFGE